MTSLLQFALLGLGAGGAYAIAAVGLVQVHRGSGVLNLSHGASAYASATLFVYLNAEHGWSFPAAASAAIGLATVSGVLVQFCVMRPLRSAPALVRMLATLGVLGVVQQGVPLIFGDSISFQVVRSFYPQGRLRLGGDSLTLPYDRMIVVGTTVALGAALWALQRKTRLGLATTAVAENPVIAASFGVAPNRVALWNWALGTALAGLAGVLLLPILGVASPLGFVFLVVPALAAAMIGRFDSFAWTIVGGLAIGVGQSVVTHYQVTVLPVNLASGWAESLPFLVIVAVLVLRGSPFPSRSEIVARLPRVGRRTVSLPVAAAIAAVGAAGVLLTSERTAGAITASAGLAIVALSLFVLTGLAGQISLAQMIIAGIGAMVAARLSHGVGWPFPVIVLVAVVAGAGIGVIFAAPALRTRGPALAVITIGIGLAIQSIVLNNGWFTLNGISGTPIRSPHLGPLDINGFQHPQRYAAFAVVTLVIVMYLAANLRAGRTGRRLLAMRSSERAASASGISLTHLKMTAFAISAAIASLGGVVLAFRGLAVTYDDFDVLGSLNVVVFAIIGGVGYALGPVLGGLMAPNGLVSTFFSSLDSVERWLIVGSGVVLIVTLIANPHGIAASGDVKRGSRRRRQRPVKAVSIDERWPTGALSVNGLRVCYGKVVAVEDLSLVINPGEIVGLIGPNGAGKTSALDAMTGYTHVSSGTIKLGGKDLTRRPAHERALAGLGRSFQTVETFDDLTVAENLAVASNRVRWIDWIHDSLTPGPIELDEEIYREAVSLGLDLDAMPDELSQGARRLLGVLRALASRPAVLLLDEPAAGLDRVETERLAEILRRVVHQRNIAMLLVEHDMSLVASACDRVIALDFGVTLVSAPCAEALGHPSVRAAYLGDDGVLDEDLNSVLARVEGAS